MEAGAVPLWFRRAGPPDHLVDELILHVERHFGAANRGRVLRACRPLGADAFFLAALEA